MSYRTYDSQPGEGPEHQGLMIANQLKTKPIPVEIVAGSRRPSPPPPKQRLPPVSDITLADVDDVDDHDVDPPQGNPLVQRIEHTCGYMTLVMHGFPHYSRNMDQKNPGIVISGPEMTQYWLDDLHTLWLLEKKWPLNWGEKEKFTHLAHAEKQNESGVTATTRVGCNVAEYWAQKKRTCGNPDLETGSGECSARFGMFAISNGYLVAIEPDYDLKSDALRFADHLFKDPELVQILVRDILRQEEAEDERDPEDSDNDDLPESLLDMSYTGSILDYGYLPAADEYAIKALRLERPIAPIVQIPKTTDTQYFRPAMRELDIDENYDSDDEGVNVANTPTGGQIEEDHQMLDLDHEKVDAVACGDKRKRECEDEGRTYKGSNGVEEDLETPVAKPVGAKGKRCKRGIKKHKKNKKNDNGEAFGMIGGRAREADGMMVNLPLKQADEDGLSGATGDGSAQVTSGMDFNNPPAGMTVNLPLPVPSSQFTFTLVLR